jgi:hypothetical protein
MFQHEQFKDARAKVFVRIGSSNRSKMAGAPIERNIGARGKKELGAPWAPTADAASLARSTRW